MKIIFFGTPDYVLPILEKLVKTYGKGNSPPPAGGLSEGLVAVVTQNPKPSGRKNFIVRSAVDNWAYKRNVPVFFNFTDIPQADLGICASFGKIIPKETIKKFSVGILNIHPSLLPKYRGASPVQETIKNGDTQTGVTVIRMDEKMDHGPIISSFKEDILAGDTTDSLRVRLFERSAQFLIDLIPNYLISRVKPKEHDHKKATFTKVLKREDGFVDMTKPHEEIERIIRAYYPWPGTWTYVEIGDKKKRLKLLPNDIVQLEGKSPVSFKQFKEGYPSASWRI